MAGGSPKSRQPRGPVSGPAGSAPLKLGRPRGAFTQHRRFDALRSLLHQHPKGLTIYELAERLSVTPRSLRRYLAELKRELELEATPSPNDRARRWRIAPAEVPRRVSVRRTQAYALLAARQLFEPLRGSTLYEEIDLAAQTLLGIARRPGRGPNAGVADARLEERFLYVPFAAKDYSPCTEALDDVYQAVADLRPLSCRYPEPLTGELERLRLHPYAMVLYKDAVYCVARELGSQQVQAYQLDLMQDTSCAVSDRFQLPADFRLEDYCHGQFGIGPSSDSVAVIVDFDERVADYLLSRQVHPSQRLEPRPDGGVRLHLEIGRLDDVATWILGFGSMAKVIEPEQLAGRVRAELEAAQALYRPAGSSPEATGRGSKRPPRGRGGSSSKRRAG